MADGTSSHGESRRRLAVVAALPREVQGLVRRLAPGLRAEAGLLRDGVHLFRLPGAVVVSAGMGSRRVSLAVEAALAAQPETTELVSIGLAGACGPQWLPGTVVEPTVAVEVRTGERFRAALSVGGVPILLATTEHIAGVQEKTRLAASYGAALVDMEAATVGRLAQARGLEFSMVKAVSDAHDFELAALGSFADARGHFRTAAFALHTALRPHTWSHAMTLGKHSQRALDGLTERLADLLNTRA